MRPASGSPGDATSSETAFKYVTLRFDPRASTGLPGNRLISLDVLRGITIAFMILVNNGIQGQRHIQHWNMPNGTDGLQPIWYFRRFYF